LLLESRAVAKIHLIAQRLKNGGRPSDNTTEVWWFGVAAVEGRVAILQRINVLMSACYHPSDDPDIGMLDLLAKRAAVYSGPSGLNQSSFGSVFVFGVIHSNIKNRTIGSSLVPAYCPQFTLACREVGVQNAVYVEYDEQMFQNEDEDSPLRAEEQTRQNQLLRAHVFDIVRGVRYFSHMSQCFYPPQSIAERRAFVEEFLSHVEVRRAPQQNGNYEEELKRLLSSLPPHQRRLLKGQDLEENNDTDNESGEIDREE
jgi:hypothetical protein